MNAKEKQLEFIKGYLKPMLKSHGYKNYRQRWWLRRTDFFIIISLQNFSWNSKECVQFCFNMGIAVDRKQQPDYKPNEHDLQVYTREGAYLPNGVGNNRFRNNTGYIIDTLTELNDFIFDFKVDFEEIILPIFDRLNTIQDCLEYFDNIPFWTDRLKKAVAENNLS